MKERSDISNKILDNHYRLLSLEKRIDILEKELKVLKESAPTKTNLVNPINPNDGIL